MFAVRRVKKDDNCVPCLGYKGGRAESHPGHGQGKEAALLR